MKKILFLGLLYSGMQAKIDSNKQDVDSLSVRPESIGGHNKKPKQHKPTYQEVIQSPPKPGKPIPNTAQGAVPKPKDDAPITAAEASAILQVAGGFFTILNAPNDPTHVTTGIGAMASGMANLFYQLMKSKGLNPELSDDELQDLADEMADMVNRGVEIEIVRRSGITA